MSVLRPRCVGRVPLHLCAAAAALILASTALVAGGAAPALATGPPPAPSGLSAGTTNSYTTHLEWTDNSGGTAQYEVNNGNVSHNTAIGATSFDWGGQSPNSYMCFRVRAFNSAGASAWIPDTSPFYACVTTPARSCQSSLDTPNPSGMVDLYHGTTLDSARAIRDKGIDLSLGDLNVDFGKGFYVTTILTQAMDWPRKRYPGQVAAVDHFRIAYSKLTPSGLCGLVFPGPTTDYLGFVRWMRTVQPPMGGAGYDFVEGPLLLNPTDFLNGKPPQTGGQQDSFHTNPGATILNAGFVNILPDFFVVDVAGGGAFNSKWTQLGGGDGTLGYPTADWATFNGGQKQPFQGSAIYWSSATGTHEVHGAIFAHYTAGLEPGQSGVLGFPTSDEQNAPGGGRENTFPGSSCGGSGSVILWTSATGAWEMHGCIYHDFLAKFGGPAGPFGYPTSDERNTKGGTGRVNYMNGTACGTSHGSGLFWSSATSTWPVHGCIFQKYESIGEDGSRLGLPISDEIPVPGGVVQHFQNGTISDIGGVITVTFSCTDYGPTASGPNACSGFSTGGVWYSGGGVGLFGQEIWTYANGTTVSSTATYSLSGLPTTHAMQLQAYIPNNHSDASHAHYHYCSPGGGCADGYVNQNNFTNAWAVIGSVCTTDGTATIVLADDGGDVYPAEVGADAIRAVTTGIAC